MSIPGTNKILIINADLDVGRVLLHSLTAKYKDLVAGLVNQPASLATSQSIIGLDYTDLPQLYNTTQKYDYVIIDNVSSHNHIHRSDIIKNSAVIRDIVNCCLDAGIKKLIYVGSVRACGIRRNPEIIDETSIFSHSKFENNASLNAFCCEQEVWRGHAEGLRISVVNVPLIWNDLNFDLFFNNFVIPGMIFLSNSSGSYGLVSMSDLIVAVEKLIAGDYSGEKVIICGENLAYEELLILLEQYFPERKVKKSLFDSLRRLLSGFYHTDKKFNLKSTCFNQLLPISSVSLNNQKSVRLLGMEYRKLKDFLNKSKF